MYSEGYLGTSKLLVSNTQPGARQAYLVLLDQSSNEPKEVRCYATSKELRHAAEMLLAAANKLDL